jgi:hypothetical protein
MDVIDSIDLDVTDTGKDRIRVQSTDVPSSNHPAA